MRALVLVDIQNDFMPGGALPVADGDAVVALANALQPKFDLVVATQDYHPRNHGSFASQRPGQQPGDSVKLGGMDQVLWPDHCVAGTPGASFHSSLDVAGWAGVFRKGVAPEIDSYSGFFDNAHRRDTGLGAFLLRRGVDEVFLCGLATDYCVKFTALDAGRFDLRATVVIDGCRGVDLQPGDSGRALDEMRTAGIALVHAGDLPD